MMMIKKIALATVVLLMVVAIAVPGPALAKEIKIKMATYLPPTYVDLMAAMQGFVDEVNEKGKGKVSIDFHHSGKLLGVKELIPGLMDGTADIVALPTTFVMGTYPITGVLSLPLLFDSVDHFVKALEMDSPLYNFLNEELKKKNIYTIFGPGDMREILWTKTEVRKPEDVKGLKIRTPGVLQAKEIEAYGGTPVTMPSSELYMALKTGVVDGALNSSSSAVARATYEVINYGLFATVPFEFYGGNDLYFRNDWFQGLPKDVKNIILEAGRNFQKKIAAETKRVVEEVYEPKLKKAGVKFTMLSAEETAAFKEKAKKVWDWWSDQIPEKKGKKAIELAQSAAK